MEHHGLDLPPAPLFSVAPGDVICWCFPDIRKNDHQHIDALILEEGLQRGRDLLPLHFREHARRIKNGIGRPVTHEGAT